MNKMLCITLAGILGCSPGSPLRAQERYLLLRDDSANSWCGFKRMDEFQAQVDRERPLQSARVELVESTVTTVTIQSEAESGDWIVIDKYSVSSDSTVLERAILLAQADRQVMQLVVLKNGRAGPTRQIGVTTLSGDRAELPTLDLPAVPVISRIEASVVLRVVMGLRTRSVSRLCLPEGDAPATAAVRPAG